jgi:hypothetical protein
VSFLLTRKKTKTAFQLIETPAIDGLSETVFSVIALYAEGDITVSRLAYDISRNERKAKLIFTSLKSKSPTKEHFLDSVCELV